MSGSDRDGKAEGVAEVTIDVASVAANTSAEQTFTVPGLTTDMFVSVNKPSLDAGLAVGNVRVSAANTLAITFINSTAGAIDPSSEAYKLKWEKPDIIDAGAVKP